MTMTLVLRIRTADPVDADDLADDVADALRDLTGADVAVDVLKEEVA